jgi:hypothetical protein
MDVMKPGLNQETFMQKHLRIISSIAFLKQNLFLTSQKYFPTTLNVSFRRRSFCCGNNVSHFDHLRGNMASK